MSLGQDQDREEGGDLTLESITTKNRRKANISVPDHIPKKDIKRRRVNTIESIRSKDNTKNEKERKIVDKKRNYKFSHLKSAKYTREKYQR